jgi:hypothetical protein
MEVERENRKVDRTSRPVGKKNENLLEEIFLVLYADHLL